MASSPALMDSTILTVDDEEDVCEIIGAQLEQAGYRSLAVSSAEDAIHLLEHEPVDVVITDLKMPGMDGMQLLSYIVATWPEIPVIMLTAFGDIPLAVEAMRRGAVDFLRKPYEQQSMLASVERALAWRPVPVGPTEGFIGEHPGFLQALSMLDRAARSDASVLLRGETGTGKELAVERVHARSARKDGPLVKLNCSALPETLLESELFGYEKGAFTGADVRKPGRVALAEGGTIFLDEIGDCAPMVQVKLLRLLQSHEFTPLGSNEERTANIRMVAATHRPLEQMIQEGTFREDLYFRLNVLEVELPPLRARRSDIRILADFFLSALSRRYKRFVTLTSEAYIALSGHDWPGNVRELENCMERVVVLSESETIDAPLVQRLLRRSDFEEVSLEQRMKQTEREMLLEALRGANDNRTLAARLLGLSRRTFYNKLYEHELLRRSKP